MSCCVVHDFDLLTFYNIVVYSLFPELYRNYLS